MQYFPLTELLFSLIFSENTCSDYFMFVGSSIVNALKAESGLSKIYSL